MKKVFRGLSLIPLCALEIYLCTAFLPLRWQHQLNVAFVRLLPDSNDWTPLTHPMLEEEVEGFLSKHFWIRVCLYGLTLLILTVNGWAVCRLVRTIRSSHPRNETLEGES